MRVMSPGIMVRRGGEKCEDGDLFLIIRLHSTTFCLERWERRVEQFKSEVSTVGGSDHRFVHNFAAKPWMDSSLSERVMEEGSQTQLQ